MGGNDVCFSIFNPNELTIIGRPSDNKLDEFDKDVEY
jgi:hypothetical protein